uniref:Uncharacterized protein n=1 Tax=Anguilla anguilla TaxID=7936 RepID=A0A0E9TIN2_ANGAN
MIACKYICIPEKGLVYIECVRGVFWSYNIYVQYYCK